MKYNPIYINNDEYLKMAFVIKDYIITNKGLGIEDSLYLLIQLLYEKEYSNTLFKQLEYAIQNGGEYIPINKNIQ